MRVSLTKGVLDVLVKLVGEGVSGDELEEKFKVVRITASQGILRMETRCVDAEIMAFSRDVNVETVGEVQINFSKLQQLTSQVNVSALIVSEASECRIISGTAVWRLKVDDFQLPSVNMPENQERAETVRTESLRDALVRTKSLIPSDADNALDSIRMVAIDGDCVMSTDRMRLMSVDFVPPVVNPLFLTRRMAEILLRFISVTGEPNVRVTDEGDSYSFMFNQSYIRAKKPVLAFPSKQVRGIVGQSTAPWFSIRREDLIDGLKKAVITSEYGEPKVMFSTKLGLAELSLVSEDMMGNKGSVTIPATVDASYPAVVRAELVRVLIDGSRGERLQFSLCEGKFVRIGSESVIGILMIMPAVAKGKLNGEGVRVTKAVRKESVGEGAVAASQESDD